VGAQAKDHSGVSITARPVDDAWRHRRPQGLRCAHRQAGFGPWPRRRIHAEGLWCRYGTQV